jgi:DNA-binding LytR/AlgR family response regulator
MLKLAIVEDSPSDIKILEDLLRQLILRENIAMELGTFNCGEDFLAEWPFELDIVFLDIHMEMLNGIEIASKIRETNDRVVIIFVTKNPQYSLAGYSVDALDYLVKPVSFELLQRLLPRALRRLEISDRTSLTIHNHDGYFVVNPRDIYFIEMENRKVIIHTKTGQITCIRTLNYIEEKLSGTLFRCHSAFLINLREVEYLKDNSAIVGGKTIPISKHRRKEFISALTDCIGDIL